MSLSETGLTVSRKAGAALVQGSAVAFDASGDLVMATAAVHIAGFAQEGGAIGDTVPLCVAGTCFAVAGAALTAGAVPGEALEVEAVTGRLIPLNLGIAVARWLPTDVKTSAADGDLIRVVMI